MVEHIKCIPQILVSTFFFPHKAIIEISSGSQNLTVQRQLTLNSIILWFLYSRVFLLMNLLQHLFQNGNLLYYWKYSQSIEV